MRSAIFLRIAFIALGFTFAGCTTFGEGIAIPGKSTPAEVEAGLGVPTLRVDLPGGSSTYFYSRQPLGRETYAVRFGSDRIVTAVEPVLTADYFGRLRVGETNAQAARELIGPPYRIERMTRQPRNSWEYWTWLDAVPTRVWLLFSDDAVLREVVKYDESPQRDACTPSGC